MIFAAFPLNLTSSLSFSGLFTGGRGMACAKTSSQTVRPSNPRPGDFAPKRVCTHRTRTHIDSPSDQVLKKIIFLLPSKKKDNMVAIMKQPHTRHVYFSFEKESLWWLKGYMYKLSKCETYVLFDGPSMLRSTVLFSTFDTRYKKTSHESEYFRISVPWHPSS